jgi:hypothetical protein
MVTSTAAFAQSVTVVQIAGEKWRYRRSGWAAFAFRCLGSRLSQPRRFDRDLFFPFLRLREGYRAGPQAGLRFQW